jgi:hypothetical protein
MRSLRYPVICAAIGFVLGWIPMFLHGPIPYKYNVLYINGSIAVWGWYTARLLIGFYVGITTWPRSWWIRGPMCGFLAIFPLSLVSLATPGCGAPCMCWNWSSATSIGLLVAGLAFAITGKRHAFDRQPGDAAPG